jgi:hypothetical protein
MYYRNQNWKDFKTLSKSDRIQKKLPKLKDEQFEYTGMKINSHFLICGGTGTGKTNALYSYLLETSRPAKGTFKHIFVVYKTEEPLYEDLKEQLGNGISFYKSIAELPSVDEFPDAIVNNFKYQYLVVLDDCVNDKDKASYVKVKNFFTYGRKKGITLAYLTQSFFDADGFIRKQMSYLLLLSIKGKTDLNNILREYGSLQCDPKELYRIFKTATEKKGDELPFLKIDCNHVSNDVKFSRDWLGFIEFTPKV